MDNTTAYLIMVLSPILYIQLQLNIRYNIVYSKLRRTHSKTFIKKNKGSLIEWLFLKRFKESVGFGWYILNLLTLVLAILSLVVAGIYLVFWISGHEIQAVWVPWIWVNIDIVCSVMFLIKHIYDRVISH